MSIRSDISGPARAADCAVRIVDRDRVAGVRASMPAGERVEELADVFGLLADPGRLRVLVALLQGEMCVCDLAAAAGASESAASHHLRLLRAHRVVQVRRTGRMAYYRLADAHVRMLLDVALTHIGHAPAAAHPERASASPVPATPPSPVPATPPSPVPVPPSPVPATSPSPVAGSVSPSVRGGAAPAPGRPGWRRR